ncbi:phage tail protein [Clostridium botulinum]|uniref:Phage tail protein n=1 Tax=Clostridium botulinum TaxID=1491 RepID=A0A0M1LJ12_CLOBO|nr:phage tail protein [Clostridium botulinum]KAI3350800.1 phage tail protein [Clostridium botulinum]KOM88792.1 tail fiber protein [Clostridium botulinum]KOR57629.1 phage tail protein [Clostridium botulinum]MBY7025220.1 phage tail protein [Clostridium botulinum]NFE58198.1 phage tail protein [Clostridium botulinum]
MDEKFYSILTSIGKAKIANSLGLGTKIDFVKMKVGDGGGKYYNPIETQLDLINTVWECNIGHVSVDDDNPNWINIEVLIPPTDGGFMIREYGVFDKDNNMLAIAKCAETYKPTASDGSTKEINIKMVLAVSNTSSINLKIDPTIIFAKKKEIEEVSLRVNELNKQIKDKINLVISETLPDINERDNKTLYFKITDVVNTGISNNMKVSPQMGIKIINE